MTSVYHDQAMELVKAQAQVRPMSADDMFKLRDELIAKMEGGTVQEAPEDAAVVPVCDPKSAIKEGSITCLICGRKMKVLTAKHLATHSVTPEQYREQFGYKKKQPLASKSLSRARKNKMTDMKLWERRKKSPAATPVEKPKAKSTPKAAEAEKVSS